jgi:hypothetical protein
VHDVREASVYELQQRSVSGGLLSLADDVPGPDRLH